MKDYLEVTRIYQQGEDVTKTEHTVRCRILWEEVFMIEEAAPTDADWLNPEPKTHIVFQAGEIFALAPVASIWAQWDAYRAAARTDSMRLFASAS